MLYPFFIEYKRVCVRYVCIVYIIYIYENVPFSANVAVAAAFTCVISTLRAFTHLNVFYALSRTHIVLRGQKKRSIEYSCAVYARDHRLHSPALFSYSVLNRILSIVVDC